MLKKRLFGMMILLVGIMLAFTLVGCSNPSGSSGGTGGGGGTTTPTTPTPTLVAKTVVIQNVPTNVYNLYNANSFAAIGIFPVGTTVAQAVSSTGVVAGALFDNVDVTVAGTGPYTVTIPLYIPSGYIRWTGSGTFDIYLVIHNSSGTVIGGYRASSVSISSATTTIQFSSATVVYP